MDKPVISENVIIIPSDTIHLATIDDFISNKLAEAGVSSSSIADIAISVSEAVNNAIEHGNAGDQNKKITVKIEFKENDLDISIKDQGKGFDPGSVPNPTDKENLLKKVGRGIFIIRSLVDSIDFNFTSDGTEVILRKNLNKD